MPDCKTHRLVGAGSGAVFAGYRAKQQDDFQWWIEVLGGAVGGYLGGQLPDVLEPAISSWHRGSAHSCAAGSGIVALKNALETFGSTCRENAEKCTAIPMTLEVDVFVPDPFDPFTKFLATFFELLWRFAAGFANGLAAGYVSHLVLDATTPRSIPLLTNGF
jgi:hypothetical protein